MRPKAEARDATALDPHGDLQEEPWACCPGGQSRDFMLQRAPATKDLPPTRTSLTDMSHWYTDFRNMA